MVRRIIVGFSSIFGIGERGGNHEFCKTLR
jgi:isopropylmalate/homocitrate/citramalate synthase